MKGLILKDLFIFRKFSIALILSFALGIFLLVNGYNPNSTTLYSGHGYMLIMFSSIMTAASINSDYFSKWNELAITMPFTKKEIVLEKYIITFIPPILGALLTIFIEFFLKKNFIEVIDITLIIVSISFIINAITLPIVYKFNKIGVFFHIFIFIAAFQLITALLISVLSEVVLIGIIVVTTIILIISFYISLKIYKNTKW